MIYFYSDFIKKLIRAGRGCGSMPYFKIGEEIDRGDFIKFANKFIEDYYATVPPEFAITHPMKFCFGHIDQKEVLQFWRHLNSEQAEHHPGANGAILYIELRNDDPGKSSDLDVSIFRQACYIRRERLKVWMTAIGVGVAGAALIASLVFRK